MDASLLYTAIAVLVDGLAGLAGGLLPERFVARNLTLLVGFAAGAILGAFFLDLMPESSASLGRPAFAVALFGFLAAAVLEWRLGHGHEDKQGALPLALLVSDALHNTADGAALAAAFLTSTRAGLATAAAVIFHELPQELGDYALLRRAGWSRGKSIVALGLVQLTAAIGAVLMRLAAHRAEQATALTVAFAAGSFLYIGAADLLPELRRAEGHARLGRAVGFALGLAVMVALSLL